MAIDKTKLSELLGKMPLFLDEKRMWHRLGFFIYSSPNNVQGGWPKTDIVDHMGQAIPVNPNFANNLRVCLIEWWEGEKKKPRSQETNTEVQVGPFDELEMPRG